MLDCFGGHCSLVRVVGWDTDAWVGVSAFAGLFEGRL